jgi:hypothetical protein
VVDELSAVSVVVIDCVVDVSGVDDVVKPTEVDGCGWLVVDGTRVVGADDVVEVELVGNWLVADDVVVVCATGVEVTACVDEVSIASVVDVDGGVVVSSGVDALVEPIVAVVD